MVYRPQKTKTHQLTGPIFLHEFATLLELVLAEHSYLLIAGDFNFHIDDDTDREPMAFLDLVNSFNLKQHVPTHQHGHTLDIMLTRAREVFVYDVSSTHYLSSDHAALICSLDIGKPKAVKTEIQFRKICNIDIEAFCNDILKSDLCSTSSSDANQLFLQYETDMRKILDNHTPF